MLAQPLLSIEGISIHRSARTPEQENELLSHGMYLLEYQCSSIDIYLKHSDTLRNPPTPPKKGA